jgi:hypothetical protein
MAEVLVRYTARVVGEDGTSYLPQACGGVADDGLWEGWIEFISDSGAVLRSPRETEQPNRDALMYWAQGLTGAYLEGALTRAVAPRVVTVPAEETAPSVFGSPAKTPRVVAETSPRPILDPFTTYAEGENLLRNQLAALSRDDLVNIVKGYDLDVGANTDALTHTGLADGIVAAVRRRAGR